ncbi:MAG: BrnT family toxin [Acidobacteriota bacterium]
MLIEWDEEKNRQNQDKHSLSFQEAQELFVSGVNYLELFDESHSHLEERFIAIGPITRGVILVVWTERVEDTIRIISARFATRRENVLYQSYLERGR